MILTQKHSGHIMGVILLLTKTYVIDKQSYAAEGVCVCLIKKEHLDTQHMMMHLEP